MSPSSITSSSSSSSSAAAHNAAPRQEVGKYELGRVLAAGDFDCRTRLCSHIITGATYAVRIYSKSVLAEASWMWDRVRMSIQVQRTLPKHENIIEMVECFETASSLYILMQLFSSVNVTTLFTASTTVGNTCPIHQPHHSHQQQGEYASLLGAHTSPETNTRPSLSFSTAHVDSYHMAPPRLTSLSQADASAASNLRVTSLSGTNVQMTDVMGPTPRPSQSSSSAGQVQQQQQQTSMTMALAKDANRTSLLWVRHYFVQVVRGVLHMHNHDVVHLGVAPDHVLINDQGQVRISNLVSCAFCPHGGRMHELRGTQHTVAPEVLKNEPYDPYLADAWSLGVLLYFMLNEGHYPYDGANTLKHILYNHIRPPRPGLPEVATDLLARLLQVMPNDRLPVEAVMQHPFCTLADDELASSVVLAGSATMTESVLAPLPPSSLTLQLARPQQIQQAQAQQRQNSHDGGHTAGQQRGSSCVSLNDTVARPQSGSMGSIAASTAAAATGNRNNNSATGRQANMPAGNDPVMPLRSEVEWRNTCDLPSPLLPRHETRGRGGAMARSYPGDIILDNNMYKEGGGYEYEYAEDDECNGRASRASRLLARFATLEDRAAFVIQRVFRAQRRRCLFREDNMALILAAHSEDAVWRQQQQQQQQQQAMKPLSSALGTSANSRAANETPSAFTTSNVTAVPMSRMIAGRVISPGPLRSVAGSFSSALQASTSLDSVRISSSRGVRLGSLAGGVGGVALGSGAASAGPRLSMRRETNAAGVHRLNSMTPYTNANNTNNGGSGGMSGKPPLYRGNTLTAGRLPSLPVSNDVSPGGNAAGHGPAVGGAVRATSLVTVVAPAMSTSNTASMSLQDNEGALRLLGEANYGNSNSSNSNGVALRSSLAAAPRPGETCPLCHRRDVAPRRVNLKPYASSTYNYENGTFTTVA